MSEMERRSGTIRKLLVDLTMPWPDQLQNVREQLYYIDEEIFEEVDEDDEYFYSKYVMFMHNSWWAVEQVAHNPHDCYSKVHPTDKVLTYEFDCQWYNGGGSFQEVLEMGLESHLTGESGE